MDELADTYWAMLAQVRAMLVSFELRFDQPEDQFALLDKLESLKLVESHTSEKHGYMLHYTITESGSIALEKHESGR